LDIIRLVIAEIFYFYYFGVIFHWGHLQYKASVDIGLVPLAKV
jgi:hypothetical protein